MAIHPSSIHIKLFLLALVLCWFSLDTGFFWDNITFGYTMGNHLFENGLLAINIPDEFDPGHPPLLAIILATSWKLFGKTLVISHLVLLPFVYGLLLQIYNFAKHYTRTKSIAILAFIFIVLDPTLDAQLILIGPEVLQLFFFFLAINGILKNNNTLKTIGFIFLGITTYRGMLLFFGIFLFDIFRTIWLYKNNWKLFFSKKTILVYIFGSIPALIFIGWRLLEKGWLQTHPDSPWETLWHFVDFKGFVRNIAVLSHRYLDFGRIGIFLFLFVAFITNRKYFLTTKNKELFSLAICSVLPIIAVSLVAKNPFGHRYFIVSYIAIALLCFRILQNYSGKKILYLGLIAILISGNFWVYPKHIAQGWDASLAHIPYFKLRSQAISYMEATNIDINQTATFFPNTGVVEKVDLSGNRNKFLNFTGDENFVFYSNVYNLSDKQHDLLENDYTVLNQFSKGSVVIEILKKKTAHLSKSSL